MKLAGKWMVVLALAVLGILVVARLFSVPVKSGAGASRTSLNMDERGMPLGAN